MALRQQLKLLRAQDINLVPTPGSAPLPRHPDSCIKEKAQVLSTQGKIWQDFTPFPDDEACLAERIHLSISPKCKLPFSGTLQHQHCGT